MTDPFLDLDHLYDPKIRFWEGLERTIEWWELE